MVADCRGKLAAVTTALNVVKGPPAGYRPRCPRGGLQSSEIATVTESLADAKLALVDAQDGGQEPKDAGLERLRSSLRFRAEETIEAGGFTYRKVDRETSRPRLLPRPCLDEGRFHTVHSILTKAGHSVQCPKCKAEFGPRVHRYNDAPDA